MIGVRAITFQGKRTASKALHTLQDYTPVYMWADDVAVVSRGKLGALHVHSTWAQDDDNVAGGIGYGALTGGLLGALAGPGGALAGAIGGSAVGGTIGTGLDMEVADPNLEAFANSLANDTSALVLVADEPTLAHFLSAAEPFGGEIIQTDLNEKDIKELRKALKS